METSQFEAVKVAIKQDKTGYVLTLSIHPDEIPEEIMRDYVGARYQVVMVRLNGHDQPMERERDIPLTPIQLAGSLCRDVDFLEYLFTTHKIKEPSETAAVKWIRLQLGIISRSELPSNPAAQKRLQTIHQEYLAWKKS
jgi:hypothetical protein